MPRILDVRRTQVEAHLDLHTAQTMRQSWKSALSSGESEVRGLKVAGVSDHFVWLDRRRSVTIPSNTVFVTTLQTVML